MCTRVTLRSEDLREEYDLVPAYVCPRIEPRGHTQKLPVLVEYDVCLDGGMLREERPPRIV